MRIIADSAIPWLDKLFTPHGSIYRFQGRGLDRSMLVDADLLLVRSTLEVNEKLLAGTAVKMVASATVGSDHVDIQALERLGIHYAHAPGCNANAVAEYVVAAVTWHCKTRAQASCPPGSAAVIGCGRIGARVAEKLEILGLDVRVNDPPLECSGQAAPGNWPFVDLENALKADIICLHTPLTCSGTHPTYHLLDKQRIRRINPRALLINAGRGAVIDNRALSAALEAMNSLKVVLDVWEHEPAIDRELLRRTSLGTAHLAGHSWRGKLTATRMIYEQACTFFGWTPAVPEQAELRVPVPEMVLEPDAPLYDAVSMCYDIAGESADLRQRLLDKIPDQAAAEFDSFRRKYHRRAEFSDLCVHTNSPERRQLLSQLGFTVRAC